MIQTLRVRDLVTIEELELELGPGLHVITGETGAGKSVLLGAVAALCGRRVGSDAVRSGADTARVEAIFDDPLLLERARELGLAEPDDDELLVARTIAREGRGKVFINGRLATLTLLSQLLGDALEITSQGEHQRLLLPDVQADMLDRWAGLGELCDEVAEGYRAWRDLAREIAQRRADAGERARREDQLRFELEQIDAVGVRVGELAELEREHARLSHLDRLMRDTAAALAALDGDAREALASSSRLLGEASSLDEDLAEAAAGAERALVEVDETRAALERYVSSLEAEPGRLEQVESRLAELERLRRRYGDSEQDILDHRERAAAELEQVGGGEARSRELEAELARRGEALDAAARRLSRARAGAAGQLEEQVTAELAALDLRSARFRVALEPRATKTPDGETPPSGPSGRERAVFQLAANPGDEPRRLRDAASGGELARLLLALRNVVRDAEIGRVLLFDEVDAGVGGATARRVGERLRSLARRHQVLCITHLPQVAALGDTHYCVIKRTRGKRARTVVELLADELRIDELARMAGGGRLTAAARAHARELMARTSADPAPAGD